MTPHPPEHPGGHAAAALLRQRKVMISGSLTTAATADACAQLMFLDGTSGDRVSVLMSAAGDDLEAALPLIDTLGLMRTPLTIDVLGAAHGAAGVVVASTSGTRRLGAAGSLSLRVVAPKAAPGVTAADAEGAAQRWVALCDGVGRLIADRTGRPLDWVRREFDSGTVHSAAQAVELGLADHLR